MMRVIVTEIISIAFILLFTFKGCTAETEEKEKLYSAGDHTIASFGETGRYAIVKYWTPDFTELYWEFEDLKEFKTIEHKVYNFKEVGSYVYTLGCCGYMKFNYETGEYQKEEDMEAYSEEDRAIFEEVERTRYIADEMREQKNYHKRK